MTRHSLLRASSALAAGLAVALAGCSTSVNDLLAGDKIDYRSASKSRTSGLEVPPDLTQLTKDVRYQQPSGTVSAAEYQAATANPAAVAKVQTVAPRSVGDLHLERLGNARWLSTSMSPDQIYPLVRDFWKNNGFTLVEDRPQAGVLETDWAENRAKLGTDIIRSTIGKVFDSAYSTGELDKFRTRIERTPTGSDIYITHRGMQEVYVGERRERTMWEPRPAEPQLEAEFLSRLMLKLGAKEETGKTVAAAPAAPAGPARAHIVTGRPAATLEVNDGFDRAWRRVGLALDRSGFTVEDRDRTQGLYFVRYVEPKLAGREEPSLLSRMFSFGSKKDNKSPLSRYRVAVKGEGDTSTVSVQDASGAPENGETGKRIVSLLLEDLK